MDLDDPRTTEQRHALIQQKPFLKAVYDEWYSTIASALPAGDQPVLEIGSGAGFLADRIPGLISSEIIPSGRVRLACDATKLPFSDSTLRAIVMTNVLHHLPRAQAFFAEAARCVQPAGAIVMIEPWVSPWSRFVYRRFHAEPFEPESERWDFDSTGPLSGANGALPWILFHRDVARFERECPEWRIDRVRPCMPFRYLLSGGVSLRSLAPRASFRFVSWVERRMSPWMSGWAMFAEIRLVRR